MTKRLKERFQEALMKRAEDERARREGFETDDPLPALDWYIRPKRRGGLVTGKLPQKFFAPITHAMKAEIIRLSREHRLSQAEFGLAILRKVLKDEKLVQAAIAAYREEQDAHP